MNITPFHMKTIMLMSFILVRRMEFHQNLIGSPKNPDRGHTHLAEYVAEKFGHCHITESDQKWTVTRK